MEGRKAKQNNATHASIYTNSVRAQNKAAERKDTPPQEVHAAESGKNTASLKSGSRDDGAQTADSDTIPEQASHEINSGQTSNQQATNHNSTAPRKSSRRNDSTQTADPNHDGMRDAEAHPKDQSDATSKSVKRVRWGGAVIEEVAREEAHLTSLKRDILSRVAANKANTTRPNEGDLQRDGAIPVCPVEELSEHEHVRALVSNSEALGTSMLRKEIAIGNTVATAHLDTCATHCFLSRKASAVMASLGYRAHKSKVRYSVEQGNPLCVTSTVHILPLNMVRNDNTVASWTSVLFIVADCGADIIIGYPTLQLGGIIDYDPPPNYEHTLNQLALGAQRVSSSDIETATAHTLSLGRSYQYSPPDSNSTKHISVPESASALRTEVEEPVGGLTPKTGSETALKNSTDTHNQKNRKASVAALSDSEPYGKNPPLPSVVLDALRLLKDLSESDTSAIGENQLREVQALLGANRPQWSQCLTPLHLHEVSDIEGERLINELMDKPRYQQSIFQTSMHLSTVSDFKEYEIPQKPGKDEWKPSQPRNYRNPSTTKIVDEWLDTLLANKKCRESSATHPAPVTVVFRPPREPRVCLNYINRNHRSEIPIFPMPDVHDFLEEAVGFEHYCSFDMAKMFTQFRIKESDKHLAAFITHRGVYEPEVVMFGLGGAPQHAVREVGGGMAKDPRTNGITFTEWAVEQNRNGLTPPYELCPVTKIVKGSRLRPFIDDVFIKSRHAAGVVKMTELFFEFCLDHHLILSRKKAVIFKKRLRALGFVVSKEGKHLDPSRIIALLESPQPRSKETLHSMLSSYTFIRMFIPNFASIAAPLYEATKGIVWKGPMSGKAKGIRLEDPDFVWTEEMTRAWNQLRAALLEAPILVSPDWRFPLFLSVDASLRGEGWVLWQIITTSDGTKVAVAILYGSRKYTTTEQKWETTRQEATAIRSALEDVEEYVFGQHFYLFSDHLNLRFMHNSVNRAVLRMRDFLAQFNMTVVHCPGAWNNADSVSRLETPELPVALASNLNSATEAVLHESGTRISQGTDTSEDEPSDTDRTLTPNSHEPLGQENSKATVLNSLACPIQPNEGTGDCTNPWCFLCHLDIVDEFADDPPVDTSDEPTEVRCHLANSNSQHNENLKIWLEGENQDIVTDMLVKMGCEPSDILNLKAAAEKWNNDVYHYPSTVDQPLATDESDITDVEWCGPIDRSTPIIPVGATNPTEKTFNSKNVWMGCKTPRTTQTTPADFRIAQIQMPIHDDFRAIHNDTSGHHGLDFSYRKLLKRCGSKWANERGEATKIKHLLKEFIDGCPTCQKLRGLREKIKCKHSFIISRPFLEVSYDFIVFKKPDKHGNRYIIAAVDNFCKLVEMKAVKNRDAETVAQFLLEVASRYGHCARLRSDREASFTGLLIDKLNKNRGTDTTPCIPYRPEANSIIERQNAIIMYHLTALIQGCNLGPQTKVGWSELIPTVFSIVNNTPKNPLGISPLSMVYGVFANYDRPLLDPSKNTQGTQSNPCDYFDSLIEWQNKLLDIAEDIQSQHFDKMNKRYNSGKLARQFHQGDFVIQLKNSTGIAGKPSARWIGPYLVMDRRDNDPSHPVLDLMNLTDMTLKEAASDDCRVFNTSWFEEDSIIPELTKIAARDLDEYVVEKIIDHKPKGAKRSLPLSKYYFLVKWEDFEEPTWEPYSGIKNLEPLDAYSALHPDLNIPLSQPV